MASTSTSAPLALPPPKPRKGVIPSDQVDPARRKLRARNRLAAIKSRKKRREAENSVEQNAAYYSAENVRLQSEARQLISEFQKLRALLAGQLDCQMNGQNGGPCWEGGEEIEAVEKLIREGKEAQERDYRNAPSLGGEEDCYGKNVFTWEEEESE